VVDIQQRELMEGSAERPELEIFQQQWTLYRKIVDNDYFSGADVYREFNRFLSVEMARPFRLLDLACGDASGIVDALKGTQIVQYHGVDLSLPTLELAKRHLDQAGACRLRRCGAGSVTQT
jgi:ubiquinone/menaquinone biosynthesis C-methylase UbiE